MKIVVEFLILFTLFTCTEQSRVVFKTITIRHIKKNDLGLIFDALLTNDGTSPKESLKFEIRSKECCLLIDDSYDCETQKIYGTKVTSLEPDRELVVTLLWPTLIPYNRVGNCTLEILTQRHSGTHVDDIKLIHFNTTINLDYFPDFMLIYFNDMKKEHGYSKCDHKDLDPFNKCKPVNCELKYFGKRNFFKDPNCVPVADCENDSDVIYDYETNTCRHLRDFLTVNDLNEIREGKFTNFIENESSQESKKAFASIDEREKILKRVRRSMNESQTFADMLLVTGMFIMKIIVLIVFLYLMMPLLISVIFYLCIGCGMISTSVTMNTFERFQ